MCQKYLIICKMDKFNQRFAQQKQKHNIKSIQRRAMNTKQNVQHQDDELQKMQNSIDLANIIKSQVGWEGEFSFNLDKPDGVLEKKGIYLFKYGDGHEALLEGENLRGNCFFLTL